MEGCIQYTARDLSRSFARLDGVLPTGYLSYLRRLARPMAVAALILCASLPTSAADDKAPVPNLADGRSGVITSRA